MTASSMLIGLTRNWFTDSTGLPATISHVFDAETYTPEFRSLCGVRLFETTWAGMDEGYEPGCMKCRRALIKRGLLAQHTQDKTT